MSDKIKIESGKLSQFRPSEENANAHTQRGTGMLNNAMRKSGFLSPITTAADGESLDGSARLEQAFDVFGDEAVIIRHDGSKPIVMVREDIPNAKTPEAKIIAYEANRIAQVDLAWDASVIVSDLELGIDLSSLWTSDELSVMLEGAADSLLGGGGAKDVEPQIDKAAELQEKWGTALGQVWQLGEHRIVCGDCTDAAVVEMVMRGERAQVVVTDPPYGIRLETDPGEVDTDYKGWQGKKGRYAPVIGDDQDYDPLPIFENFGYCGEMFLWGADYYAERIPNKNKGSWLVWDKRSNQESGSILSPETLGSEFELCWSKNRHKRYIIRKIWGGLFGTETQDVRGRIHPTQKPVEVISWVLEHYTKSGWIVADSYLGSGTTLVACENLKRKCRGIEIDPGYLAVTIQRWADLTSRDPVRLSE